MLLLFRLGQQSTTEVLNSAMVAQEIVRSVAGTLGLIAAVPITTALAALVATRPTDRTASADESLPQGHQQRDTPDTSCLTR